MSEIYPDNALEVIPGVHEVLVEEGIDYRILGGVATAAISEATSYDIANREIEVSDNMNIPRIRDNGTVRDLDVLVMSDNTFEIQQASEVLRREFGEVMVMSAFGFIPKGEYLGRSVRNTLKDWTTSRLMSPAGNIYYAAHPFIQEVKPQSYEAWTVSNSEQGEFITLSPPAHSLAYKVRSIGGLRARDEEKVKKMDASIDELFKERFDYERDNLEEWFMFREMLYGRFAFELYKGTELYADQHFSALDLAIFDQKRKLMKYADSKQWALNIAQGKGPLGRVISPVLEKINDTH